MQQWIKECFGMQETAPKYKLTYFKNSGLDEPIHIMLYYYYYGVTEIEYNGLEMEVWPQYKSSMPFGKLPVLEMDGKVMHQFCAIMRYLAKPKGLAGSNDFEAYEIDALADTINDLRTQLNSYFQADEETKKKYDSIYKEIIPYYMSKFEERLKNNKGYFVGGKLTWVDIFFGCFIRSIGAMEQRLLEDYPNLIRLIQRMCHYFS